MRPYDIRDIEKWLTENKAPKRIWDQWNRVLGELGSRQTEAERHRETVEGLRDFKRLLEQL